MNQNSMFYWWPKVKNLSIPQPQTIMVEIPDLNLNVLDGKPDQNYSNFLVAVEGAAKQIGFPCFIRGDQCSNKHDWKESCYVPDKKSVRSHVRNIIEFTYMVDMLGEMDFKGVAVRELLDLVQAFKAFWGKMPVCCERRYFAKDGKVVCWHPYWPPMSIKMPSIKNWQQALARLQTASTFEIELLTEHAETISKEVGGYWSIDFCKTKTGKWYLTDMATADTSFHWPTCSHAPPEMLKQYGDPEKIDSESVYDD